ncbi:PstS family phosphate ABC transporter substrate-binding protein [Burkholderia cepacia]|uniref:PstS family phosphate ABC transporter substrate-binding protein n=1 Tax=Burkholderia cepacia TaxID=292 RepID=UPI0018C4CD70|nr:substrate-binding domain-containing protein [Burkholderia cepacia]
MRATVAADAGYVRADGAIAIVGGNGVEELIQGLDDLFRQTHPEFRFKLVMKGSATAMPALSAGTSAFAPMTRDAWGGERAAFKQVFGYAPEPILIGHHGFGPRAGAETPPAVYVNARNPLPGLTIAQLTRIFTSGAPEGDINLWSQLDKLPVPAECRARRIHLYGERDDGGAATERRHRLLGGYPFTATYEALADSDAVLDAVADDVCGIGLVGWSNPQRAAGRARVLALGVTDGAYFEPSYDAVAAGRYPLAAPLVIYVNHPPGKPLEPWIKEYLEVALSPQGQALLAKGRDDASGLVPLSADTIARERRKLDGM